LTSVDKLVLFILAGAVMGGLGWQKYSSSTMSWLRLPGVVVTVGTSAIRYMRGTRGVRLWCLVG